MIDVTEEMIEVYDRAWREAAPGRRPGDKRRAGIRAVLEIVERDYLVESREEPDPFH